MRKRQYTRYFSIYILLVSFFWISIIYSEEDRLIKIGSKKFTESVILGEIATQMGKNISEKVIHIKELGGTRILWNSLLRADIDIYPEYTGTIIQEILAEHHIQGEIELEKTLKSFGIQMSKPLGFNNTYALGMKRDLAEKLDLKNISDLKRYPDLKFGLTNEFLDRGDGWPHLKKHYNLPQDNVRGLDHDLAYRGLESDAIDIIDLYSTDAEIEYYDLKVLSDDQKFFTDYKAVLLYRSDLQKHNPRVLKNILKLEDTINEFIMIEMNGQVKLYGLSEKQVAGEFLKRYFNIVSPIQQDTFLNRLMSTTIDHLILVLISLTAAILISIPLGILSFHHKKAGQIILGITGIFQTIPSLALLVFMIPLLGIGAKPAIFALFLYSLLPIIRNTYSGLSDIPNSIRESSVVLGISTITRLRRIEIPLATRSILAGIKTSAVINIGTATLGALIGAGGYGQPILTGIRLDNTTLILEGAIPAACLALIAQGLFDLLELIIVPKGLRIGSEA
jgi:osmoprotectant transport system permease protein